MKPTLQLCLAILIALPLTAQAQLWPTETLRSNILGAWTRTADFDQDNDPDILVQSGDTIFWFENLRPGWTPHIIDLTFYNADFAYVSVFDLDSDGDLDVFKAPVSNSNTDTLTWNENQSNGTVWVKHTIGKLDASLGWSESSYGDLDDDGDVDLVISLFDYWNIPTTASLYWLENENNTGTWARHPLNPGEHWFSSTGDMDGDGDLDIVASQEGIFWLENQLPDTSWDRHTIVNTDYLSNLLGFCANIDSDNIPDVVSTSADSLNGGMACYSGANSQKVLVHYQTALEVAVVGDVDGDGDIDIPYGGLGIFPQALGWAENQNDGANWVLHDITDTITIQMIPTGLADIDGDGDMDMISLTFDVNTAIGSAFWAANPQINTGTDDGHLSAQFALSVQPNPFTTSASIGFQLDEPGEATLIVCNALGQAVHKVNLGRLDAGMHTVDWDGRLENGSLAPGGSYFIRLETGDGKAQVIAAMKW